MDRNDIPSVDAVLLTEVSNDYTKRTINISQLGWPFAPFAFSVQDPDLDWEPRYDFVEMTWDRDGCTGWLYQSVAFPTYKIWILNK